MIVDDEKLDNIVHKIKNLHCFIHAAQKLFNRKTHLEEEIIKLESMVNDMIADSDKLSKHVKRVSKV